MLNKFSGQEWFGINEGSNRPLPPEELATAARNMRIAIQQLEPAGDVRELYIDALEIGIHVGFKDVQGWLDEMLVRAIANKQLSPEEVEMIKSRFGPHGR